VGDDATGEMSFADQLGMLGFRPQGTSRRGGRMWSLRFNRYLTFVLHDYGEAVVLTWSYALGEYLASRGWRSSVTDTSVIEVYPEHDVRLPCEIEAVGGEINRVLAGLRLDLGEKDL